MIFKEKHTPTHRLSRPFHARTGSLTRRFLITVQTLNFRILFSTTKVLSFRPTSNHLHLDSSFLTYLCVLQKSLPPKNELPEQQIHRTKSTFFYLTAGFRSADHLFVEVVVAVVIVARQCPPYPMLLDDQRSPPVRCA